MVHEIPLERRTLHGHFSRDLEPVLEIDSGDTVRISTPNAGWYLASGELFEPRDEELDGGHALAGPILVRGAREGQTLAVRIDEVVPGPWGVTFGAGETMLRWELDGERGRCGGYEVELRPFLGVLGMPPVEPGVHSTGPPRPQGGNIDCAELVAGTTLFLPIPVRRRALLRGRRARPPGRRRGQRNRDRVPCRGDADALARRRARRSTGRSR